MATREIVRPSRTMTVFRLIRNARPSAASRYQEPDLAASLPRSLRRDVMPLAIAQTIVWATLYYSFPALLPEWERDLGWSKTEISGAFTAALLVAAVLAPMAGRLIDHGAARLIHPGGALLPLVSE